MSDGTYQCQYCGRGFELEGACEQHEAIHESGYWDEVEA